LWAKIEITYRRLISQDKNNALNLIQSRIDANSRVCLTDNRINQAWVDNIMRHDITYDVTHRVFGAYVDGVLNTIFVLRLKESYYIVSMMISTKEENRPAVKMIDGYTTISADLLDFSMRQMEEEGYNVFYSIIPDHSKWKRAERNPTKKELRYDIEEVLKVPANTMPISDDTLGFSVLDVISRPFNLNMVIRKMTKRMYK
jgi:hypothetical protein